RMICGAGKEDKLLTGTIPNPGLPLPPERRLSWCVELLPYIEGSDLYTKCDLTGPADSTQNRTAGDAYCLVFLCPVSPEEQARMKPYGPVSQLYYVGLAGVGPDAAALPAGDPRAGVFGYDRRTALSDITDGTSNTIVLMEITSDPGRRAVGG